MYYDVDEYVDESRQSDYASDSEFALVTAAHEAYMQSGKRGLAPADYGAYMPSPLQICLDAAAARFLYSVGFSSRFVASCIQQSSPPFFMVARDLYVGHLTPEAIEAKYEPFREASEYD